MLYRVHVCSRIPVDRSTLAVLDGHETVSLREELRLCADKLHRVLWGSLDRIVNFSRCADFRSRAVYVNVGGNNLKAQNI